MNLVRNPFLLGCPPATITGTNIEKSFGIKKESITRLSGFLRLLSLALPRDLSVTPMLRVIDSNYQLRAYETHVLPLHPTRMAKIESFLE